MKKLLIVPCLVFLFFSCDNGNMEETTNPFVGTWENEDGGRFVFNKNVITSYYTNGDIYYTGTYTYDDTHITVKLDTELSAHITVESWGDTLTLPYRFEDGLFILFGVALRRIT